MVPIFRWDDALLENSKESTDKLLELISEFNKVTGHKTNAYQKNQLYFYILTMNTWKLKLKIQYHLQSLKKKKKKYLGVELIKHIQELYAGNDKTRIKEIKEVKWSEMKVAQSCPTPMEYTVHGILITSSYISTFR